MISQLKISLNSLNDFEIKIHFPLNKQQILSILLIIN